MTARPAGGAPARLVVDPVRCDGVGICAYVAARLVDLDRWGYPVLPTRALDRREQRAARAAAADAPAGPSSSGRSATLRSAASRPSRRGRERRHGRHRAARPARDAVPHAPATASGIGHSLVHHVLGLRAQRHHLGGDHESWPPRWSSSKNSLNPGWTLRGRPVMSRF